MKLTDSAFTPSELILLNGDKFAPEVDANGHQLLCSDGMVNGHYLAVMMMAAAILANEEEGALEIELRMQKRKLFSSVPSQRLILKPVGQPPSWNGYTLESAILFSAGQFFAVQGDSSVRNVVYSFLMENREYPWQKIIEFVEWGLATSNWLMPVEGDALKAFQIPFICPDKVQELAFAQPLGPVKQLFSTCKKITPELWQQLLEEIDLALKDRVG
ncbi:MAG: hypothetical protein CVU42_01340 [Chloroflexi bacterium HGW-Chloroflexi-4]|jgi:hypothetical protein|nr:MAG: hypothetical protein CVU42_01340 [Chloroflexi bacterium HGW-Chloroflexi-4]